VIRWWNFLAGSLFSLSRTLGFHGTSYGKKLLQTDLQILSNIFYSSNEICRKTKGQAKFLTADSFYRPCLGSKQTKQGSSYDAHICHFVGNACIAKNVSNIKMVHLFSKSGTKILPFVEYKSLELFIHGDVLSLSDIRRATDRQMVVPVAPTACYSTVIVWCFLLSVTWLTLFCLKHSI
jgi:hypothetical protein